MMENMITGNEKRDGTAELVAYGAKKGQGEKRKT